MVKAAEAFDARLVGFVDTSIAEEVKAFVASRPKKGKAHVHGPVQITEKGVEWKFRPGIPYNAYLSATYLSNECIHDELMDAGIEMFELRTKD